MESLNCDFCGIEFEVYPYRTDSASYCSKSCKDESEKNRVERECDSCGSNVIKKKSQDELSTLSFCDRDCKFDYFSGENNPNWSGGNSSIYYGKNWEEQRAKVIDRDNQKCQICGEDKELLHVHHIKPFKDFENYKKANELANLKTLCASCHATLEHGPIIDRIIESAEEVHKILGKGHSESTYHSALERELSNRQIPFASEGTIPITYKGTPVGKRRPDMFVSDDDGQIVVELKAGSRAGEAQLIDYQNILEDDANFDIKNGLLIRFNDDVEVLRS